MSALKSLLRASAAFAVTLLAVGCATHSSNDAAASPSSSAAAAPAMDPAMWVVRDADTTIYLFGTFHLLPPGQEWLTPRVREAFNSAQTVRMELASVDPTPQEAQSMMAQGAATPGAPTVISQLTPAEAAIMAEVAGKLGGPVQMFDGMRPWLVNLLMSIAMITDLGMTPDDGAEKVLMKMATETGKPIEGFETFLQQIGFFASMSDATSMNVLRTSLGMWSTSRQDTQAMLTAWQTGDAAALEATVNKYTAETPEFRRVLLEDRNRVWAQWLDGRMDQPGTVFVAVGAGHLVGNDSVQVFLAQHGHRAQQVTGRR
jgi:uncharacterized protein